jgi:hypothetical protein
MHSCGVTRNIRKGYAIASFHSFGSSHMRSLGLANDSRSNSPNFGTIEVLRSAYLNTPAKFLLLDTGSRLLREDPCAGSFRGWSLLLKSRKLPRCSHPLDRPATTVDKRRS